MSTETIALDCPACPETFSGPNRLAEYNAHRREEHARPEPAGALTCVQCPGRFPDQEALDRHARIVHGPAVCPEPECTFRATNRSGLNVHRKRDHGMADLPPGTKDRASVEPEAVGESAVSGAAVAVGEPERASGSSIFECPDCGVTFSRGTALASHRRWKHPETVNGGEQPGNRDARGSVPSPGTVQSVAEGPVRGGPSTAVPPVDRPGAVSLGTQVEDPGGLLVIGVLRRHADGTWWIHSVPGGTS